MPVGFQLRSDLVSENPTGTQATYDVRSLGLRCEYLLRVSGQLYYVPHTYTGIAVSLLFLGRLVYRLIQVSGNMHAIHAAAPDSANQAFAPSSMLQSPLTLGLYFVLMGYYVCYYSMVLWKSKRVVAEEATLSAPLPGELEKRT